MTRHDATKEILAVSDRLSAWADTAQIQLIRARPGNEEPFRNQRDNYRNLSIRLALVADEIDDCGVKGDLPL